MLDFKHKSFTTTTVHYYHNTRLPCVVDFVSSQVIILRVLFLHGGCLQFPVIQTMQEHLGKVVHNLPLSLWEVPKFVQYKV